MVLCSNLDARGIQIGRQACVIWETPAVGYHQIYYTSWYTGFSGREGLQIQAATQGIPFTLLDELVEAIEYTPPQHLPSAPSPDELAWFPQSLVYQPLSSGDYLMARTYFLGLDYTGAPGNYFSHAVVLPDEAEALPPHPITLWRATHWAYAPSEQVTLEPMAALPPGDYFKLEHAGSLLLSAERQAHLTAFLDAILEALRSDRCVVVVDDQDMVACWIALASLVLPSHLVKQLSFNTYVHDPHTSKARVMGTTAAGASLLSDEEITTRYRLFDLSQNRYSPQGSASNWATNVLHLLTEGGVEQFAHMEAFVSPMCSEQTVDEFEEAFTLYYLLMRHQAPPAFDPLRFTQWCTGHSRLMAPLELGWATSAILHAHPDPSQIVAPLGAMRSSVGGQEWLNHVDQLLAPWLVHVAPQVDPRVMAEVLANMVSTPDLAAAALPALDAWKKAVDDCTTPLQLCSLIQLGDRFALFSLHDRLEEVGETKFGPFLGNELVQSLVLLLASQPQGKPILTGIANHLEKRANEATDLSDVAGFLTGRTVWPALMDYAQRERSASLYVQLVGLDVSQNPEKRAHRFEDCVNRCREYDGRVRSELLDIAITLMWGITAPTLEEAAYMARNGIDDYRGSKVPERLCRALSPNADLQDIDARRWGLVEQLLGLGLDECGVGARVVEAFRLAHRLQHDTDPTEAFEEIFVFLAEGLGNLAEQLLASLVLRMLKLEDVGVQVIALERGHTLLGNTLLAPLRRELYEYLERESDQRLAILVRWYDGWFPHIAQEPFASLFDKELRPLLARWKTPELEAFGEALQIPEAIDDFYEWIQVREQKSLRSRIKRLIVKAP